MRVDVPDLGEASTGFDPIEAGRYEVVVSKLPETLRNKDNTADYLKWEFTIPSMDNRKLWTNTSLQKQALFGLKGLLVALEKGNGVELQDGASFDATACVGLRVDAQVIVEEYEGVPKNKIQGFFPSS